MLEYIIALIIIALTVVFFVCVVYKSTPPKVLPKTNTPTKKPIKEQPQPKEQPHSLNDYIIKDNKAHLIKSIKEVKNLKRCYIYNNGHVIVFSDDKRVTFCNMKSIKSDKGTITLSKNVELDLISDISYSEDTKTIACALKNSKEILFYRIEYNQSKNKLSKKDMKISTSREYEIRNVVLSKSGQYVSTSVNDKDTEVQIYSTAKGELMHKIDTGGIHNLDMKMSPDDNYLGIATFLNEISVIHFEKNEKFNKEVLAYETTLKVSRKKSVSGIKEPILSFEFSNDDRFFTISCASQVVKVFQNFGNFSESKPFSEFKVNFSPNVMSLFVEDLFNGKLQGVISIANGGDIYIYDAEGNVQKIFKNAHEDEVIKLKIVKVNLEERVSEVTEEDLNKESFYDENDDKGSIVLISASRDGRIKFWDLAMK